MTLTDGKYILDDNGNVVPCHDLLEWGRWLEKGSNRFVKQTKIGTTVVSTIFLGLDYSFGSGPPLYFETMVFHDQNHKDVQWRYTTREEAIKGHDEIVKQINNERGKRNR